jgi:ribosomal protein S17
MITKVKNRIYKVVKKLYGYQVSNINSHNIICSKKISIFIKKYQRYYKKINRLKVFNSTDKNITIKDKVIIGYLGRKITTTKSHTIIEKL